jgi:hypothetical protein
LSCKLIATWPDLALELEMSTQLCKLSSVEGPWVHAHKSLQQAQLEGLWQAQMQHQNDELFGTSNLPMLHNNATATFSLVADAEFWSCSSNMHILLMV